MSTSQSQHISMSIEIEASADTVWAACSSQEALRAWFNDTLTIEPRLEGAVGWEGMDGEQPYRVQGQVTELAAPRRMTVEATWDTAPGGAATRLSLELSTAASGTNATTVTLRHHGFDQLPDDQRAAMVAYFERYWDGDELLPLKMHVEGVGPSH